MPRFRVVLRGAPVFLQDGGAQPAPPLAFLAVRWIRAKTAESAGLGACRLVLAQLAAKGTGNPPDRPVAVTVNRLTPARWLRALWPGRGRGFSFYPDDEVR
ncbi:MAG TPA: hypothetical protein VHO06_27575 [Polyangia bacterium]|nr:hypothetical protein [Polyangia bacterium]